MCSYTINMYYLVFYMCSYIIHIYYLPIYIYSYIINILLIIYSEGRIQSLVEWLKKQPYYTVERQKVGSKTVDIEIVKKIEEIVDNHNAALTNPKQVIMQVKPHLLYKVIHSPLSF